MYRRRIARRFRGEAATLIKEMRACHKAFERLRNLETEISAIYEVIESEPS